MRLSEGLTERPHGVVLGDRVLSGVRVAGSVAAFDLECWRRCSQSTVPKGEDARRYLRTYAHPDACTERGRVVIWSLVHTKGGVGKTTTVMFLAAAAMQRGIPVRVVDADPQGSASSWADRAAHRGTPLPFDVSPATAANVRALSSEPDE